MHAARFDDLVRVAGQTSRRTVLGTVAGGIAVGLASRMPAARAQSVATPVAKPSVCDNLDVPDLQARQAGDLIGYEEITDRDDPNFPANARAFRVQYVSTGRDNTDKTLVCGVVVLPADLAALAVADDGGALTGRVVAWAHGTLGLVPRCQPSRNAGQEIWGEPPYGIGPVAWGSDAAGTRHVGAPEDGILAGMIGEGWIVAATDYVTGMPGSYGYQPYLLGKQEAANVVDSVRAAHHLLAESGGAEVPQAYDVVAWGHSQGGHAAIWTGQVLAAYEAATRAEGGPGIALAGVAAEAPGSNFLAADPADAGYGVFDWSTHTDLKVTGIDQPIPLGPFILNYVFNAWNRQSTGGTPDPKAMPAYPDAGVLDLAAVGTPDAVASMAQYADICWADGAPVVELTAPYRDKPFLVPELDQGPVLEGRQHGNWDVTCAGDPAPGLKAWCDWLRFQNPGPNGVNPFDKVPMRDGRLVPVWIAAGGDDGIAHCVAPDLGAGLASTGRDCAPAALYASMLPEYCPDGGAEGYLALRIWQPEPGITEANHSDITGLVAAVSADDLRFKGSPLEQFISGAFAGTLTPGCTAEVVTSAPA